MIGMIRRGEEKKKRKKKKKKKKKTDLFFSVMIRTKYQWLRPLGLFD